MLEEKYNELQNEYLLIKEECYWEEYLVEEGEVIADKGSGCSITVERIDEPFMDISIDAGNGNIDTHKRVVVGTQFPIDDEGGFSIMVCRKIEEDNPQWSIVVKENKK